MQPAAERARALSDPTRLRLLALLLAGEATVNDLAAQLDLAQPRISTHLAILRRAGLVEAEASGRQHVYRVEPERVRPLLAVLASCAEADRSQVPRSDAAARAVRGNTPLRQARTCYDHLAGVAGVGLLDELLRRDWL